MVASPKSTLTAPVLAWASRLRFPYLFALIGLLFLLDLAIPDLIPFADEMLLGLATILLGSWRKRKTGASSSPPTIDVEPIPQPDDSKD